GEVVVAGRAQAFKRTRDARRAGIAVVHQELSLVTDMSGRDTLVRARAASRRGLVDAATPEATARDLVRRVLGVTDLDLTTPVGHLGVGVQQILEIARALADQARV